MAPGSGDWERKKIINTYQIGCKYLLGVDVDSKYWNGIIITKRGIRVYSIGR